MKSLFSILLIVFVLTINYSSFSQSVSKNGKLAVKGVFLKNEKGNDVVLRGISFGWHNWWPRFYNEDAVKWLTNDWKCTVVRVALGVGPRGSYLDKPEWSKEKIESVVKGAIENDIYVIIDWHSHEIKRNEAIAFFSEMAGKYGKFPNVIYEIFNEPVKDSWDSVKNYSIEVIKAIREKDPDNIILVGCPHWDQDIHLVADNPIEGFKNLMYTVHFYAGTHGQFLRDRTDYAIKKGIPVFVSECAGMEASGNGPINYTEWNNWVTWMEANKISWVCWSIADKNETCSMLKTSASDIGNWKTDDLKEWGLKTRDYLIKYNSKGKTDFVKP